MPFNILSVAFHASFTAISTGVIHYLGKKPAQTEPTAHFSYHSGLEVVRRFLEHAARHTVEELQAFTGQKVPTPYWVATGSIIIPAECIESASHILVAQLGPEGVSLVGGSKWWQWRDTEAALVAEWLETRKDYNDRRARNAKSNRIILYIHGGAYFFGSVDTHRYQLQRHARKLKARVFARKFSTLLPPDINHSRFRLAPQFPFPCGLHDCLAAYLYLISIQKPEEIILAGDSSGGGMVVSMLVTLRDQNLPLPAGAVLISPWVDLTHSFPSVAGTGVDDYIPICGFMHRPSAAWPPPNPEEYRIESTTGEMILNKINSPPIMDNTSAVDAKAIEEFYTRQAQSAHADDYTTSERLGRNTQTHGEYLRVEIEGAAVEIKEQIHLYTTNKLISHPLVSPALQPSLGGLPPLLVISGGGELLRDEQIYLAHKAANPEAYLPSDDILNKYDPDREILSRYKPTYVQLQVWNSLCHVAPTLSFTRPAKHMYRSVAQFSAWALSRAQESSIDIPHSSPASSGELLSSFEEKESSKKPRAKLEPAQSATIGKAGDPIPPFQNHMIRQMVDSMGNLLPLPDEHELPALQVPRNHIGVPKPTPVRRWLAAKEEWDLKFKKEKNRLQKERLKRVSLGIDDIAPGDCPPPSSQAARRGVTVSEVRQPTKKSAMLALWNALGAVHDTKAVQKDKKTNVEHQFPTLWRGVVQDEQQGTANVARPSRTTEVVADIGQSNESQRELTTKSSRATPEASVPQIWRSPSSEEFERARSTPRGSSVSRMTVGDERGDLGDGSVAEPPSDKASIRTIRHSKGVISPLPASADPLSDYESVLQPGPYSGDNQKTAGESEQKNESTFEQSDVVLHSLPTSTSNRLNKESLPWFDFELTTDSSPQSELEPFASLPAGSGGDALDNRSGYSSNYSQKPSSAQGIY
ncbi:lipase/esterase [Nannizzia gypsea CBS 118893]|uniref:Lipase/esterase n=1 Tax=Arthroderma gypseum (strain ATCC MYA-4604 / CBS 118893) TaxID=535722 RepID=E4V4D4_ARTGP|nr:lipase/esterase [Nannizzia gypsea CBS 118893]EFR04858.1 lipase/esterase [Nannizzia gypsea CBS 118893]